MKKAKSYAQGKYYLDLLQLVGDAFLFLSLNQEDKKQCEETIRRGRGILDLYHLETLHPNSAAQFHFQSAIVCAANEDTEEALKVLGRFERCVWQLLEARQVELHGDGYFNLLDTWFDDQLPFGSMVLRDRSFNLQNLKEAMQHPVFHSIKEIEGFQKLAQRLTERERTHDGIQ